MGLLGVTWVHLALLWFTWVHLGSPGLTWVHFGLLGLILVELVGWGSLTVIVGVSDRWQVVGDRRHGSMTSYMWHQKSQSIWNLVYSKIVLEQIYPIEYKFFIMNTIALCVGQNTLVCCFGFFSCPEQLLKSSCPSIGRLVGRLVGRWCLWKSDL